MERTFEDVQKYVNNRFKYLKQDYELKYKLYNEPFDQKDSGTFERNQVAALMELHELKCSIRELQVLKDFLCM